MTRADQNATPYEVRRSTRARRARLTVGPDGEVVVVLPTRAPLAAAQLLVEQHAEWVERQRARALSERARLAARLAARPRLGEGRILPVGGHSMRVAVVDGASVPPLRGRVEPDGGLLIVRIGQDGHPLGQLLEAWLRDEARAALSERVGVRAAEMGVRPGRLGVRDQRSRWGSASASGNLSFSWRLILTPPEVLDAVVVHELAHLVVRGHGSQFWRLVSRHAPQTPSARRWLREHARELRAALEG